MEIEYEIPLTRHCQIVDRVSNTTTYFSWMEWWKMRVDVRNVVYNICKCNCNVIFIVFVNDRKI